MECNKVTQEIIDTKNSRLKELPGNQNRYKITIIHPSAGVNWSGGSEIFAIEISRCLSNYFDIDF